MKTSLRMGLVFMVVFLLCSASPLFAELITIDWEWDAADEDVVAFRYQLDAEDPDGWTVVDASVTEFSFGTVEDTSFHTLYLQQSYDSENWSPSGMLAYDPVEFGVSLPASEEAVEVAQIDESIEATQMDEPVVEPLPSDMVGMETTEVTSVPEDEAEAMDRLSKARRLSSENRCRLCPSLPPCRTLLPERGWICTAELVVRPIISSGRPHSILMAILRI